MTTAIHTEDLVKKFGRLEALKTLYLSVPQGAVYALVGPRALYRTRSPGTR